MQKLLLCLVLVSFALAGCNKQKEQYTLKIKDEDTGQQKHSELVAKEKISWQKVLEFSEKDDFCSLSDARLKLNTEYWPEEVVTEAEHAAILKKTSINFALAMLAKYQSGQQAPECFHRSLDFPDSGFNHRMDRLEMLHLIGFSVEKDRIYGYDEVGITKTKFEEMLRFGMSAEAKAKSPDYRDLEFYLRWYSIKPSEVGLQTRHHLAKLRKAKQEEEEENRLWRLNRIRYQ